MDIPYITRSRFLAPFEQHLPSAHMQIRELGEHRVALDPGGYEGVVRVVIRDDYQHTFETDWHGSDPTRFPVRIRAAATVLRSRGYTGTFLISHSGGALTIRPA